MLDLLKPFASPRAEKILPADADSIFHQVEHSRTSLQQYLSDVTTQTM